MILDISTYPSIVFVTIELSSNHTVKSASVPQRYVRFVVYFTFVEMEIVCML